MKFLFENEDYTLKFQAYLRVRMSFILSSRARCLGEGVHQSQVVFMQLMAIHHDGS